AADARHTGERPLPPARRRPTPPTGGAGPRGRTGERTDGAGARGSTSEPTGPRGKRPTPTGARQERAGARQPAADDRPTEVQPPIPRRSVTRRTKVTRHAPRTFGRAMGEIGRASCRE